MMSTMPSPSDSWNHHPSCCHCSNSIHTSETTKPAVVVVQTLYIPVKPPNQLLSLFKLYTYQWNHQTSCCRCSNSIHTSQTTTPAVVIVQTLYIPVKPPPQLLSLLRLYTYQSNHHPSCCHCSNSIHTSDNFSDWKNVTTPYESK